MTVSLKEVVNKIEEICDNHNQVNDFRYGRLVDVYKKEAIIHTCVIVDTNNAIINPTDISLTLSLTVVDKILKDNINKLDVESETLLILSDIVNEMTTDNTWRYCGVVTPPTAVKVVETELDVVNGWVTTIQLRLMKVNGIQDIPTN